MLRLLLVLRTRNSGTNETDGFFRQARRRPAVVWGIRQGAATTHGEKRRCFMFRYFRFATLVITLLGLASLLAGCGQKGPLRLPDETTVATQQK